MPQQGFCCGKYLRFPEEFGRFVQINEPLDAHDDHTDQGRQHRQ